MNMYRLINYLTPVLRWICHQKSLLITEITESNNYINALHVPILWTSNDPEQ